MIAMSMIPHCMNSFNVKRIISLMMYELLYRSRLSQTDSLLELRMAKGNVATSWAVSISRAPCLLVFLKQRMTRARGEEGKKGEKGGGEGAVAAKVPNNACASRHDGERSPFVFYLLPTQ